MVVMRNPAICQRWRGDPQFRCLNTFRPNRDSDFLANTIVQMSTMMAEEILTTHVLSVL